MNCVTPVTKERYVKNMIQKVTLAVILLIFVCSYASATALQTRNS